MPPYFFNKKNTQNTPLSLQFTNKENYPQSQVQLESMARVIPKMIS